MRRLEHQPDAAYFELVHADFAKSVAAGEKKRVVVQLYNAGWHGPENLVVPDATGRTSGPSPTSARHMIREIYRLISLLRR